MSKYSYKVNIYLSRYKRGDESAFDKLYNYIANHLRCVAYSYLSNKLYTDDVVADVFVKLPHFIYQFDPNSDGYNWLYKIVRNVAFDYNKLDSHTKLSEENYINLALTLHKVSSKDTDSAIDINCVISELDAHERDLIERRFFRNQTFAEIAECYGVTKAAIYKRLQKILAKIREKLQN